MCSKIDISKILWKNERGQAFEDLVAIILENMFPGIEFKHTDYSHDGGKDFYAVGGGFGTDGIWVEAKNYNRHLELGKFSNTFIMADIGQINRIIIFSVSELTNGARINVARYAAYHKKTISVYAGNDILYLIKKYKSKIDPSLFWINPEEIDAMLNNLAPISDTDKACVSYEHYRAKQFNFTYRRDYENHIKKNQLDQLPLYSILAQEAYITNSDLFQCKTVKLDRSEYSSPDFDAYPHYPRYEEIQIAPSSTAVIVTYLRIVNLKPKLCLPMLNFNGRAIKLEPVGSLLTCCWLGEVTHLGDAAVQLNNVISDLNNSKCFMVSGKSGVGKSRFLREAAAAMCMRGHKIIDLDFRSINQLSLKSVLQTLLGNIFLLDVDENNDIAPAPVPRFNGLDDSVFALYKDFYCIIYDDNYDCQKNVDRICALFCDLFKREKITLLLDNMQDLSSEAIEFFEKLFHLISNDSSVISDIFLCFNKDFLTPQKASTRFFDYLSQSDRCQSILLSDFTEQEAILYLEECMDPGRRRADLEGYYCKIIEKFGTNPFTLKQLMLYLKQRHIINFDGSLVYVSEIAGLSAALEALPPGISLILNCRYAYLLQEASAEERALDQMIWSILFFDGLPYRMLKLLMLNSDGAHLLVEYGFAEYNVRNELVFCHQLIEKYFCLRYMGVTEADHPTLNMIRDSDFLRRLLETITLRYQSTFCVQKMLIRNELNRNDETVFANALEKLRSQTPRAIMLPLILDTIVEVLEIGIFILPDTELKAAYRLCMACQERYDGPTAAQLAKPLIEYEQQTYSSKLAANESLVSFFKHYVFLLPVDKKFAFLDWLIEKAGCFALSEKDYNKFMGWLHNRYGKNLHSVHDFTGAEYHIRAALEIALRSKDYSAAAEAEIEYGNIYLYSDAVKAAAHWDRCVQYIKICGDNSIYFQVYRYGYSALIKLLRHQMDTVLQDILDMQELRSQTFLYQKLFIDDVYADYCIIASAGTDITTLQALLPHLNTMKSDSYMYAPIFTLIASYKQLTVHRLLYKLGDKQHIHSDMVINLAFELIDNGVFTGNHLEYSKMILLDLADHCVGDGHARHEIVRRLPPAAKEHFITILNKIRSEGGQRAITPLTDAENQINLLLFNYEF